jgi:hypothetical protein
MEMKRKIEENYRKSQCLYTHWHRSMTVLKITKLIVDRNLNSFIDQLF